MYSKKIIKIAIENVKTGEVKTIEGLKVSAIIEQCVGMQRGSGTIQVWGIDDNDMYQLTTRGTNPDAHMGDKVTLWAGDNKKNLEIALVSTISEAIGDYNPSPENMFVIQCLNGQDLALSAPDPESKQGEQDVRGLLETLATEAGYEFQPFGAWQLTAENPYLTGSALERFQKLCGNNGLKYVIGKGAIQVYQADSEIADALGEIEVSFDSPDYTLLRSPRHTGMILELTIRFNPRVQIGQTVNLKSTLKSAVGAWQIKRATHDIQSFIPDGLWETHLTCDRYLIAGDLNAAESEQQNNV